LPREILEKYRILRGKLAEILYTGDHEACADVLGRMWVFDNTACQNGLVNLLLYRPTVLRILKLDRNYIFDDVEYYRIRTSGRIYNRVIGRKAYALVPFVTPYIALTSFYHARHSSPGVAVPAVFFALVDQSSLVDAENPKKKHKKVYGGGSITLEACGRENIHDNPRCVELATIRLMYRGRGRLALAHSPAAIKILRSVRLLLSEGRESDARVLMRSFLDHLGIETRGKQTDDLVAMIQALHQPHRAIKLGWEVDVNRQLPREFRDSLYKALRKLLTAASVRLGGKHYIIAFSTGGVESSLDSKHIVISPAQPPGNGNWEEVPRSGMSIELEHLETVRVAPVWRPVKQAVLYSEAQKRAIPEEWSVPKVLRLGRKLYIDGAAELEYVLDEHTNETRYRVYLASGSWEAVFYRYR